MGMVLGDQRDNRASEIGSEVEASDAENFEPRDTMNGMTEAAKEDISGQGGYGRWEYGRRRTAP